MPQPKVYLHYAMYQTITLCENFTLYVIYQPILMKTVSLSNSLLVSRGLPHWYGPKFNYQHFRHQIWMPNYYCSQREYEKMFSHGCVLSYHLFEPTKSTVAVLQIPFTIV